MFGHTGVCIQQSSCTERKEVGGYGTILDLICLYASSPGAIKQCQLETRIFLFPLAMRGPSARKVFDVHVPVGALSIQPYCHDGGAQNDHYKQNLHPVTQCKNAWCRSHARWRTVSLTHSLLYCHLFSLRILWNGAVIAGERTHRCFRRVFCILRNFTIGKRSLRFCLFPSFLICIFYSDSSPLYLVVRTLIVRHETTTLYFHLSYLSMPVQDVAQFGAHLDAPVSGKKGRESSAVLSPNRIDIGASNALWHLQQRLCGVSPETKQRKKVGPPIGASLDPTKWRHCHGETFPVPFH
ncbi:uncharacterized protein LOC121401076 [Xenopus laevis]|uniref:Uncharacterized protein LOC121401076 n=1 Tax=Xenopus laevis TaxID=8355 RepID=A0A8J1MK15_XENLA|nr:uncharacterized protein LOC121401076 [Xenopus laevis]XP_041441380.1 uncharacterized protein LOC121401076 [Xenopus laevis]